MYIIATPSIQFIAGLWYFISYFVFTELSHCINLNSCIPILQCGPGCFAVHVVTHHHKPAAVTVASLPGMFPLSPRRYDTVEIQGEQPTATRTFQPEMMACQPHAGHSMPALMLIHREKNIFFCLFLLYSDPSKFL